MLDSCQPIAKFLPGWGLSKVEMYQTSILYTYIVFYNFWMSPYEELSTNQRSFWGSPVH